MNAYEDPDWEGEAEAAEAEEKNAEFWARFAACARKMNKAQPLIVKTLQPGMQLVVTLFEEDGDPLSIEPIEFTILDPKNCKILVKEKRNFPKPTQGTLLGSEHFRSPPYKRIFQEGKLRQCWWLNYEAGGKKFDRDSIPHTIKRIEIILPSGS